MKQNPYNKEIFNKIVDKMTKLDRKKMKQIKNKDIKYLSSEGAVNISRWILAVMQGGN